MLRASSNLFPSYYLTSPPILGNNNNALIRLSLFSSLSLSFSSFKPPSLLPPSASHKFPLHSNKTSLPISPSPTSSWWAPPMDGGNTRPKGRVSFSTGNNGDGGRELLVQHLLVGEDNLKLLTELQQRIAGGVDLSDLAVEYSICPSKEQGGMLGWVRKGQMVPEFEEAAFGAPLNKVVRCKTKFGWHLLQVLAEREESLLQDIEPKELHEKMQDPSFFEEVQLIDVREPDEVVTMGCGHYRLPNGCRHSWGPHDEQPNFTHGTTLIRAAKKIRGPFHMNMLLIYPETVIGFGSFGFLESVQCGRRDTCICCEG